MTDEPKLTVVMGTGQGGMRLLTGAGAAEVTDKIDVTPTIVGPHGRAWICDTDEFRRWKHVKPEDDGSLVIWCVEAPWAHPVWHSYMICLMHLRPLPGARETKIYLDGATHEMWVYALDNQKPRQPFIKGQADPAVLTPLNFAAQFIEVTDDLALGRIKQAVIDITEGKVSPDTDFTPMWVGRFGGNMMLRRLL